MQIYNTKKLDSLVSLLWGEKPSADIFNRWSQGFEWSSTEPLALIQNYGGPCSVIAPVQAFFLKRLLFADDKSPATKLPVRIRPTVEISVSEEEKKRTFTDSLIEILLQVNNSWSVCISNLDKSSSGNTSSDIYGMLDTSSVDMKNPQQAISNFHKSIFIHNCTSRVELETVLTKYYQQLFSKYGVLLFLYTALLSRGVDVIRTEHDNLDSPMIDPIHGHGGQSLLNLMLSGEAVPNVFDGSADLSGLTLRGISHPCPVGFLTLLETYKLCTVGNSLKRPEFPVWIVGSETHYSVVFSLEGRMVAPISARKHAETIFNKYSEEGGGFVQAHKLGEILTELNLESEPEYVELMAQSLDPDQLGIILLNSFIQEYFQAEDKPVLPNNFEIYYYNGLTQSATDKQVRFRKGMANVIDWQDNVCMQSSDSPIEDCLQMRFPGMSVSWVDGAAPSLN